MEACAKDGKGRPQQPIVAQILRPIANPAGATLRLPPTQVDHMLTLLRLNKCADTKVGGAWQRGVSGGTALVKPRAECHFSP